MMRSAVLSASVLALASSVVAAPHQRRTISTDSSFGGSSVLSGSSFSSSGSSFGGGDIVPVFAMGNNVYDPSTFSVSDFSNTHSFDMWGGISSLSGFDSFYGANNFCGNLNVQDFSSGMSCTCHSEEVTILQQQLAIIGEFAKRLIVEQVCEVETQTIVWSQWLSGLQSFSDDLRHHSHRKVSYDHEIASHINGLCDSSGNIITSGFDFEGSSIGSHSVTVYGLNWSDEHSPPIVDQAFSNCQQAAGFSLEPPSMSSFSSSCGSECSQFLPPSMLDCGSECSSSFLPPSSSDCGESCGSSIILPSSSDCGESCSSSIVPPPSSDCGESCSSSIVAPPSIPPPSDCGLECPIASSGDVATDSAGFALPTNSAGGVLSGPTQDPNSIVFGTDGSALPTGVSSDPASLGDSAEPAAPTDAVSVGSV